MREISKTQSALTVSPRLYRLHSSNTLLCESPRRWFLQSSCRASFGTCSCTFGRYFRTEDHKLFRISRGNHLRMMLMLYKSEIYNIKLYRWIYSWLNY